MDNYTKAEKYIIRYGNENSEKNRAKTRKDKIRNHRCSEKNKHGTSLNNNRNRSTQMSGTRDEMRGQQIDETNIHKINRRTEEADQEESDKKKSVRRAAVGGVR